MPFRSYNASRAVDAHTPGRETPNVGPGATGPPALDVEARLDALRRVVGPSAPEDREAAGALEDLAVAARAAWAGGIAACRFYGGELQIRDKGEDDPVTAADHAADAAILDVLGRLRPADPVLSEERRPPADRGAHGRLWVVDPLDGTKEFIAENGEFSIMVGLAGHGCALLGAVYQPATDRLFAGLAAGGAWVVAGAPHGPLAHPLDLAERPERRRPLRFVRSRSHPDERLRRFADALGDIEEVISGSVGIKCALVAQGLADLYVHPVPFLKEWDTCAPEAVLRGAGGTVTDCAGGPLGYGKADPVQPYGIFAATEAARRIARPILREVVRGWIDPGGADGDDEPHVAWHRRADDQDSRK